MPTGINMPPYFDFCASFRFSTYILLGPFPSQLDFLIIKPNWVPILGGISHWHIGMNLAANNCI